MRRGRRNHRAQGLPSRGRHPLIGRRQNSSLSGVEGLALTFALLLLAACPKKPEQPALRITDDTLAKFAACAKFKNDPSPARLKTYADLIADADAARSRLEPHVRECGFTSFEQYEALAARMQIAQADAMMEQLAAQDPAPLRASIEQGLAGVPADEREERRRSFEHVVEEIERARAWRAARVKTPPLTLETSALFSSPDDVAQMKQVLDDEVALGSMTTERRDTLLASLKRAQHRIVDVARAQPPLSEDELRVLRKGTTRR